MFNYTIQAGDTLNEIASRFDVSLEDLLNLNPGVDPNNLWVGQIIRIPAARSRRYPQQQSHPNYNARQHNTGFQQQHNIGYQPQQNTGYQPQQNTGYQPQQPQR
jgi:LysM repeat protein